MSELKFRAWDKRLKKMFYGPTDLEIADGETISEKSWAITLDGRIMEWCATAYYPWIHFDNEMEKEQRPLIMQCTGIKDNNGKDIYEGDWLDFVIFDCFGGDTSYRGVVVYSGSRFMLWKAPGNEFYGNDGGFDLDWVLAQDDEAILIGNIYENPEVLEQANVEKAIKLSRGNL